MGVGPEAKVERANRDYAVAMGFAFTKYTEPGRVGPPDRKVIGHGLEFFIEYKARGKKPCPKQRRDHARRRAEGVCVYVVDDQAEGERILRHHAENGRACCPGYKPTGERV